MDNYLNTYVDPEAKLVKIFREPSVISSYLYNKFSFKASLLYYYLSIFLPANFNSL
jgi:hypothetical protein